MKISVNDIVSIIFLIIGVVSYMAGVLKKVDTKHARMWTDIENTATNLVAQQEITDKSGADKKSDATSELIKQAKELGHDKITNAVAKGAIENAVNKMKETNTDTELLDDIQPIKEG